MCHLIYILQNELHIHALVWFEFQLFVNFHNLILGFQFSKQTKISKSNMAHHVYISCLQTFILWIYDIWLAFPYTNDPQSGKFVCTIQY